jgi:hypothetical protein
VDKAVTRIVSPKAGCMPGIRPQCWWASTSVFDAYDRASCRALRLLRRFWTHYASNPCDQRQFADFLATG